MNRILASFLLAAATAFAADISGDWEFTAQTLGDTIYARVTLKADGNKLSGDLNELKLDGTIDGDKFTFTATRPNGDAFGTFEGAVHGDESPARPSGAKPIKSNGPPAAPHARPPLPARSISNLRNFIASSPMRFLP